LDYLDKNKHEVCDRNSRGRLWEFLFLIVFVVYLSLLRLDLRSESPLSLFSNETQSWQQPAVLESSFPKKIGSKTWQFDYDNIESLVRQSKLIHQRGWRADRDTLSLLENIIAELPSDISEETIQRIQFLLSKNLIKENADALVDILRKFVQYQKRFVIHQETIQKSIKLNELDPLKSSAEELLKLQKLVFGAETAIKLFSERNLTSNYLNSRILIRLDTSIDPEAKLKLLSALKADYQNSIERQK
jgi:hypothetical protein